MTEVGTAASKALDGDDKFAALPDLVVIDGGKGYYRRPEPP